MTDTQKTREERGARRVLEVIASKGKRPQPGLLQHEFLSAFSSDGWTVDDLLPATKFAYSAGWIDLSANFYCLTRLGEAQLATSHREQSGSSVCRD